MEFWRQAVREAEVMKKDPLVIYRWNRSKDYICWNDKISIKNYIEVKTFDCEFKMGLIQDWIEIYKKVAK